MNVHEQIRASDLFVLYQPVGPEVGTYRTAKDCANAVVVHPCPERMMVRGFTRGREVFRMSALDFGMAASPSTGQPAAVRAEEGEHG